MRAPRSRTRTWGAGKPVSVTGISITGADAGNYTLQHARPAPTADITARLADGDRDRATTRSTTATTAATVTLSDDRVAGDALTASYASAEPCRQERRHRQAVTVTGLQ